MVRAYRHIPLTPLTIAALGSIALLLCVATYRAYAMIRPAPLTTVAASSTSPVAEDNASWEQEKLLLGLSTSSDPTAGDAIDIIAPQVLAQLIGEYAGLQQSGTYSSSTAAAAAAQIAANVRANVSYEPVSASQIKTDADSSYARMMKYRDDMRVALQPLLQNDRAEYEIYGNYVATGDKSYLRELQTVADRYHDAGTAAAAVTVPADIVGTHAEIVNALLRFSSTLNAMATHADDPIASVALLRTYNDAESDVLNSFDKLATYERLKTP
ncbi:MAG: hypothetical protein JO019_04065 [Candidatus Kaiserbacteria bacterium]|nr:hypothetical protein [Candidatus Kaiserbacteria bacterium]